MKQSTFTNSDKNCVFFIFFFWACVWHMLVLKYQESVPGNFVFNLAGGCNAAYFTNQTQINMTLECPLLKLGRIYFSCFPCHI